VKDPTTVASTEALGSFGSSLLERLCEREREREGVPVEICYDCLIIRLDSYLHPRLGLF